VINPGDLVIAYADGAFEARDKRGERFGIDRIRQTARFDPSPRSRPSGTPRYRTVPAGDLPLSAPFPAAIGGQRRPKKDNGPPEAPEAMTQNESQTLFRSEYRQELEIWLRRRFRYLCIVYLAAGAAHLLWMLLFVRETPALVMLVGGAGRVSTLAVIGYYLFERNWDAADRAQMLSAATRMILIVGAISLLTVFSINRLAPEQTPGLILPLFVWHFSACLFLPWTPRESLRPFVPLFVVWALLVLLFPTGPDVIVRILTVVFGPAVLLPGLGIAAWRMRRHSQSFRNRMVGQHFMTMRREFSQARTLHESMFPPPYDDGHVRFEYTYTPMRELGGDYIHFHVGAEGLVHLVLLDVTGHGLAAALTVNRLHGELDRIRAESPQAEPGDVLTLINRYISLTMTRYNIYATAACATLDPYLDELRWASAGHPPGYLRGVNGGVREVAATTVVLGAVDPDSFRAEQQRLDLAPDDTLVLFTDGVFECRNRVGRQLGLGRVRELMALRPAPRHWPRFLASAVDKHSGGLVEDDSLIAALTFCASRGATKHEPEEALAASPHDD
jgi:serine phosphatase RsbU (regulator of sigma subunit)